MIDDDDDGRHSSLSFQKSNRDRLGFGFRIQHTMGNGYQEGRNLAWVIIVLRE